MLPRKVMRSLRRLINLARQRRESPNAREMRTTAQYIHESAELRIAGDVTIGSPVTIGRNSSVTVQADGHLICDDHSWVGDNCEIDACGIISIGSHTSLQHRAILIGEVSIGAGCLFGPNFYASSAKHRFEDQPELPIRWQDAQSHANWGYVGQPVSVGEDCWFGTNVVVMPGITIGRGCIIGANSIITRDIPPYSVVAGSPARVLRARLNFSPPQKLFADCEKNLPYFYAGFRQWGNDISKLKDALHNGGWLAKGSFSLAMSAEGGDDCELKLEALSAGVLKHGACVSIPVSPGVSTIYFQASPNPYGILEFVWSEPNPSERMGIVIFHAKKCSRTD